MFDYPRPQITPRDYELQVKATLDAAAPSLSDYRSEHREILAGLDGEFEIDVTVRFSALGGTYLTLIECKHYKRPVGREKVQALLTKMQSVGAHKGMIFSTSGFQSGASEYAKAHGIALIEFADGRTSYIIRSLGSGEIPWSAVPDEIPRIVGWMHDGDSRMLVTPDHPDPLRQFIGAR
jgi:restriction system protein